MMQIEINDTEAEMLVSILSSDLSDLKTEIHKTDSAKYRKILSEKKDLLMNVLEQLDEKIEC
jgi:hypothetical protein